MNKKYLIIGIIIVALLIPIIKAGIAIETHGYQYTIVGSGTQAGVTINVTSNFTLLTVTKWSPDTSDRVSIYNVTTNGVNQTLLRRGYFSGDSANVTLNLTRGLKYMIVTDKIDDSTHAIAYAPVASTNFPIIGGVLNWVNSSWQGVENGNGYNLWNVYSISYSNNLLGANQSYFNSSTYQTARENILTNWTLDVAPSSAIMYYNGTSSTSTITNTQSNVYQFSNSLDIPSTAGYVGLFYWNITYPNGTVARSNSLIQTVNPINMSLCNYVSTQNRTYINFTFVNETAGAQAVKGFIPSSTWSYYLGFGTSNRSLSYVNTVENSSFPFCFTPVDRSIRTTLSLNYKNGESEQRTFNLNAVSLSNTTLQQPLYLLPSNNGIFNQFSLVNSVGTPIIDVLITITRTFGGGTIPVTSAYSDGSGLVSFFLDPDVTYTATFVKAGFGTQTLSFTPSSSIRTITLGGGSSGIISNGTVIAVNTTYTMLPSNLTLANQTAYLFSFAVNSSQTITLISMNITNSSGFQLSYQTLAGAGTVSDTLNTVLNKSFNVKYTISTATESFIITRIYTIGNFYIGDYSLYRQLTLFNNYEFSDFYRILIIVLVIMGSLIFLSKTEIIETMESKIIVVILLTWIFAVVGWLDTGITTTSALGSISNQYGIPILITMFGIFFLLRRNR